jgi:hypothetical protein
MIATEPRAKRKKNLTPRPPLRNGEGEARQRPLLLVPVAYQSLTLGAHGRLGVSIAKDDLSLDDAYEHLCNRRIVATLLGRPEGAGAAQPGFFGEDGDTTISSRFEIGSLSFDGARLKFSLSFDSPVRSLEDFGHVAGRKGMLTVQSSEKLRHIPPEEPEQEGSEK